VIPRSFNSWSRAASTRSGACELFQSYRRTRVSSAAKVEVEGANLGGDPELVTGDTRVLDTLPDLDRVGVDGRGVDVAGEGQEVSMMHFPGNEARRTCSRP
jgi:hypothetical protein